MGPLISVVVPVGPRHDRYLPTALASIAYQTLPADWVETVVVHDTDGHGAGWARNTGLERSTAPLIVWLDSDDYLTPTALEALLRGYAHYDEAYVYGDWWDEWDADHIPYRVAQNYNRMKHMEGGQHVITTIAAAEDIRSVGGFDNLKGYEDWDYWCKFAVNGLCGAHISHPVLVYRISHGFRRQSSYQIRTELKEAHVAKYGAYILGEKPFMGCCNGNATAKNAARRAVGTLAAIEEEQTGMSNETVRMEFVGRATGAVSWRSPNTREVYRGGNNAANRFINAHPDDVNWLLQTGLWKRVPRIPAGTTKAPPPPMVAPLILDDDSSDASGSFEIPVPGRASTYQGMTLETDAEPVVEANPTPVGRKPRKGKIIRDEA